MPIGDLLASITGEKSRPSPAPPKTIQPVKRKAEEDAAKVRASKSQRASSSASIQPLSGGRNGDGPPASASPARSAPRPASHSARPTAGNAALKSGLPQSHRPRIGPAAVSSESTRSAADGSATLAKSAPKKGSFAEIMARAAKAQQSMGQVGKIQHKPLDKGPLKRERSDVKADGPRGPRSSEKDQGRAGATGQRVVGDGMPPAKTGGRDRALGRGSSAQGSKPVAGGGKIQAQAVPEVKRPKKAAVATTGYQGTARPPPGASSKGGASSTTSAGNSTRRDADRRRIPFGSSRGRSRRDDEYDEMDDFIDDDEGEEPEQSGYGADRYRYASEEDESDMEAGMSDIDEEERAAELLGRREDREQEALEQRLKREKEDRKRRLVQAAAAKQR